MIIYHTSPRKITEIRSDGVFGSGLFFALDPYWMKFSEDGYIYSLDRDNLNILEIGDVAYDSEMWEKSEKLLCKMAKCLGVSNASEALEDMETGEHTKHDCDLSFLSQKYALDLAKNLGFDGVELRDEQGTAYLIDMTNLLDATIEQKQGL